MLKIIVRLRSLKALSTMQGNLRRPGDIKPISRAKHKKIPILIQGAGDLPIAGRLQAIRHRIRALLLLLQTRGLRQVKQTTNLFKQICQRLPAQLPHLQLIPGLRQAL